LSQRLEKKGKRHREKSIIITGRQWMKESNQGKKIQSLMVGLALLEWREERKTEEGGWISRF
jgi:hypothetical protein